MPSPPPSPEPPSRVVLGEVEDAVAKATVGPWQAPTSLARQVVSDGDVAHPFVAEALSVPDATFIAACDPPTIAALCQALRKAQIALAKTAAAEPFNPAHAWVRAKHLATAALAEIDALVEVGEP